MLETFINGVVQFFLMVLFFPGMVLGIPTLDFLCSHGVDIAQMCAPDPLASSSTSVGESIFTLLGSIFFYTVIAFIIYFYRKRKQNCMNFKKKFIRYLPYRKMDELINVTFFFSTMTNDEAGRLHDNFNTYGSWTCPHVNVSNKTVTVQFLKDNFNHDSTIALLQKDGFSVLPDKVKIEPSKEHELNCISIIILGILVYLLLKVLL